MAVSDYHPLLVLKINLCDYIFKDDCKVENSCDLMVFKTRRLLMSAGNRKANPTI